jgi:glycosyltransferase involved in cell wall biosynthesis
MSSILNDAKGIVVGGSSAPSFEPNGHLNTETNPLVVIGVCVHNEEANIEACLRSILNEAPPAVRSVIVIASGCTDRTAEIVQAMAEHDDRLTVVIEPLRSGKSAAINLFLRRTSEPLCVLIGGDIIVTPGFVSKLLAPFADASVGMTGGRPVPTNPTSSLMGGIVHVLWDLHHEIALNKPKLGEAVAFRRVFDALPTNTVVDEPSIEQLIVAHGLRLQYVPEAIVRNRGPENVLDFVRQRSRNHAGYLGLIASTGYRASSLRLGPTVKVAWRLWRRGAVNGRHLLAAAALEATARVSARVTWLARRRTARVIWRPILTSKRVLVKGQALRAAHRDIQTVHVWTVGSGRLSRAVLSRLRLNVREDDQVTPSDWHIRVRFRSDLEGVAPLCHRLKELFPEWTVVVPEADAEPKVMEKPL